jgi:hypothetical protein
MGGQLAYQFLQSVQKTPKVSAAVMHSVLEDILVEIVGANVDAPHQIDRPTDAHSPLHSLIILRTHPLHHGHRLYRSVGFRGGLNHGLARETLAGTAERACRAILAKDAILSFFSMSPNRQPSR